MQRILLVEDNEMNRDLISRRLKRRGYAVLIATDGVDGVETATREKPDLILMDIALPLIDGYEATRLIKANADTRHTPVIGLSAHAMSGDADRALDAGCDDYDTKPIEWPRLLGKIQTLLERAEAHRAESVAADAGADQAPGSGIRLLVLGEATMRTEMLAGRLSAMGHGVDTVGDVDAAFQKLAPQPHDAVFLDVAIEGLDGASALEALKAQLPDRPIFIFSTLESAADASLCLERGAAECVVQPFRTEELRHRLDTHLELARHRSRPPAPDAGAHADRGDAPSGVHADVTDRRVEHLMRALLPPAWIDELRQLHKLPPRQLDDLALLQWDLPALAERLATGDATAMTRLQRIAVGFEDIAEDHGAQVVDIDNLGVLVMVPGADQRAAALAAVKAGLALHGLAEDTGDALRAAVHAGPVVAGVVGHRTWRFGLWGGSVTLVQQACHSVTRGLHITDTAWRLLQGRVLAESAGSLPIEGGALPIFRVESLS